MEEIGTSDLSLILVILISNIAVTMWWFGWPRPVAAFRTWLTATRLRAALGLTFACVALWVGLFFIYRYWVTTDITGSFLAGGREVMAGHTPQGSPYMPGFLYIMGIIDFLFPFKLTVPLFFTLCYALASVLAIWLFSRVLPTNLTSTLVVVGFLNGAAWLNAIGYQEDETLMLLFAVATMCLLARGNNLQAGLVGGLGLICTKTTFVVFLLPLLFQSARPRKFVEGVLLTGGLGLVLFTFLGFDPQSMLFGQTSKVTPPNLINLLAAFSGVYINTTVPGLLYYSIVGAFCLLVAVFLRAGLRKSNPLFMAGAVAAVWIVFLLLAPKSLPVYRLAFLPLLPAILSMLPLRRAWMIASFALYSTLLGIESHFYEHWVRVDRSTYDSFITRHLNDPQSLGRFAILLVIDASILLLEVLWLAFCLRARSARSEVSRRADARVAVASIPPVLPTHE